MIWKVPITRGQRAEWAMKMPESAETQIAFVLKDAEDGMSAGEL